MAEVLAQLVRLSGLRDAYVEMIATRGLVVSRDPREFENRFYAYAIPFVWISPAAQQEEGGLHLIISSVERISDRSVDPTVKNFHWGDLTRSLFEAFDAGARHAVLVDRDGNVTEGAGFNIFVVRDGALATPGRGVLLGIHAKDRDRAGSRSGDRGAPGRRHGRGGPSSRRALPDEHRRRRHAGHDDRGPARR